jgi:signal transduction histidine kinase
MKKTTLLLMLLLASVSSFAQRKKIDSLLKVVDKEMPDSNRLGIYYSLAKNYLNISIDSVKIYANKGLEISKRLDNTKSQAHLLALLGVAEKNLGNYDKAISYHLQSLKISEASKSEKDMAITYNDLGVLYENMKRWDDAEEYFRKSNALCKKVNLVAGISMTYNNIGNVLINAKQDRDSAMYYYQLGLAEAEKTGDTYSIATCLANVGDVYLDMGKYDLALSTYKRSLNYDKENEDKPGMSLSYLDIGIVYDSLKMDDIALKYVDSALELTTKEHYVRTTFQALETKIKIEKKMGNYAEAVKLLEAYIDTKDSVFNEESSKQISELQTKYETEKKEKLIKENQLVIQRQKYQLIAVIILVVAAIVIAFMLYSRQQLKQRQAREKAILDAEYNERMRIAKDVHDDLGSGLSKISLVSELAQQKALGNVTLSNDIQQISSVSKELQVEMNEVDWTPDRTGNMTERISHLGSGLSKITVTAEEAHKKADGNANLSGDIRHISTMSKELVDNMRDLIWVLNPENTTLDNLVSRLREYCGDYLDGMPIETDMNFPAAVPDMRISREAQRNIFLTVKESINNCIKHAKASKITIDVKLENNALDIQVIDNGKGFDMANLKRAGNGLRNMKQRIELVGGTYTLESIPGTRTAIHINIGYDKLSVAKNTTIV